jgi:methylglutaconyl-CoA hydratase
MIRTEQKGSARWIVLNRPEIRNALSAKLMTKATTALVDAVRDPNVRSIVIAGEGTAFSAGADLNEMKAMRAASQDENIVNALSVSNLFYAIAQAPKPVITRVHGPAIAGALGIVAASDYAVAVRSVSFAFTEVRIGIAPAMISPFVVWRIGAPRARRLFMTGESFSAEDAAGMGLVDRVVDESELDATIESISKGFEACAPQAIAAAKRIANRVADGPPESHRRHTAELIAQLRASDEGQEGMAAFLEKRKPSWAVPKE